jgi:hypothetical protein
MRKSCFANNLRVFSILLLFLVGSTAHALTVWTNGVTPDVVDDNIDLASDIITLQGPGPVSVTATNVDIAINMVNPGADVTIQGQAGGDSRLYLNVNNGHTITVNMTKSLILQGSAAGVEPDLLVAIRGLGKVVFNMDGGTTLTLTSNGVAGGNVQMYVVMDVPLVTFTHSLVFQRNPGSDPAPNSNVEVVVEGGSILSYLSTQAQPTSTQEAEIIFDTTNADGSGRSILTVGNASAVIVRGRLLANPSPTFQISDINPAVPAGFLANFVVENFDSATSGSLLVQNYNNLIGELIWDPWANLDVRNAPPFGTFSGEQYGFIIGSFGSLEVDSNAYLDYVGLTGTVCVAPNIPGVNPSLVSSKVKARSGSALFTDAQPDDAFAPPLINIGETAGIFFRSGVDNNGVIRPITGPNPYTIDPLGRTPGSGIPVFDIEGVVNIVGANTATQENSLFQLLSLEVNPTGGPLFAAGTETIFPLRTFLTQSATDPCSGVTTTTYVSYNNASFLNNGRANLFNVSWEHTDQNHHVFEKNDITSEPAYIGGETWLIQNSFVPPFCMPRPKWAFVNSRFNVHTSVALTGVDLLVPNGTDTDTGDCIANSSLFVFYQNGKVIDNGTGRQMNLGTYVGSTACDGCTVISKDAQLDVMQTEECVGQPTVDSCDPSQGLLHLLSLQTAPNTNKIVEGIVSPAAIANQFSIQTIYLGNNSNISVGTFGSDGMTMDPNISPQTTFPLTTCPELLIDGNFFSFETRGGENGLPETSNVTGQGGIFVDTNGTFAIGSEACRFLANMGVMVTRSSNGIIDLPKNQVFFDPRVGLAIWDLDLNDPNQIVIIPVDSNISDYTLNWQFTVKNYTTFSPYIIDCINTCTCPVVTEMNVTDIPTIQGTVQQLQLEGTRLGDPAHIKIDGGIVEELVFIPGYSSASAPVAVVVLENQGTVGLGTAHRNIDSTFAEFTLGANGVNLILNSSEAKVVINEDMIINNVCAILPGPGIGDQPAKLTFTSDCCNTLRVTKDGVLDLSMFETGQVIEFAGNLNVVFEPGARVIFNGNAIGVGPTLRWADQATCVFNPIFNTTDLFTGSTLANTDPVRVIFTGIGQLEFADCSRAELMRDAFVGIESLPSCDVLGASINLNLIDSAQFFIGGVDCQVEGGALQIGNVVDGASPVVSFNLIVNGPKAKFEIGPQGFFGAGVGIVSKGHTGHDSWRVAPTANLSNVTFTLTNGIFRHPQIYAGSDDRSALFAISNSINGSSSGGQGTVFNADIAPLFGDPVTGTLLSTISLLGGGNFIVVASTASTFNPIVGAQSGPIGLNYSVGLLASRPLIATNVFANEDAAIAFEFLRLQDISSTLPSSKRGVAGPSYNRNEIRIGWLDNLGLPGNGQIGRQDRDFVQGQGAEIAIQQSTLEIGAAGLIPAAAGAAPRPIIRVASIGS